MSVFNHIYSFDELPKDYQKKEDLRLECYVIKQAKLMGIDTKEYPHHLKDEIKFQKELMRYCDNGFGKYFKIEIEQII